MQVLLWSHLCMGKFEKMVISWQTILKRNCGFPWWPSYFHAITLLSQKRRWGTWRNVGAQIGKVRLCHLRQVTTPQNLTCTNKAGRELKARELSVLPPQTSRCFPQTLHRVWISEAYLARQWAASGIHSAIMGFIEKVNFRNSFNLFLQKKYRRNMGKKMPWWA